MESIQTRPVDEEMPAHLIMPDQTPGGPTPGGPTMGGPTMEGPFGQMGMMGGAQPNMMMQQMMQM